MSINQPDDTSSENDDSKEKYNPDSLKALLADMVTFENIAYLVYGKIEDKEHAAILKEYIDYDDVLKLDYETITLGKKQGMSLEEQINDFREQPHSDEELKKMAQAFINLVNQQLNRSDKNNFSEN